MSFPVIDLNQHLHHFYRRLTNFCYEVQNAITPRIVSFTFDFYFLNGLL